MKFENFRNILLNNEPIGKETNNEPIKQETNKIIIQTKNNQIKMNEEKIKEFQENIKLLYLFYILRDNMGIDNLYQNLEKKIKKNEKFNCSTIQKKKETTPNLFLLDKKIKNEIEKVLNENSIIINNIIEYYKKNIQLVEFIHSILKNKNQTFLNIKYPPLEISGYHIQDGLYIKDNGKYLSTIFYGKEYFYNNSPNTWGLFNVKNKNPLSIKIIIDNYSYDIRSIENNYEMLLNNSIKYTLSYTENNWFWINENNEKLKITDGNKDYIYRYNCNYGWGWFCGDEKLYKEIKNKGKFELEPRGYKDLYHPPKVREISENEKKLLLFSTIEESRILEIQSIDDFINKYKEIINILCSQNCNDKNYSKITRDTIQYIRDRKGFNFCFI